MATAIKKRYITIALSFVRKRVDMAKRWFLNGMFSNVNGSDKMRKRQTQKKRKTDNTHAHTHRKRQKQTGKRELELVDILCRCTSSVQDITR